MSTQLPRLERLQTCGRVQRSQRSQMNSRLQLFRVECPIKPKCHAHVFQSSIDSCKKAFSQTLIVIGNCQLHSSAKRHLTVFHSSRFEEHLATEKFVNLQQFNFSTVVSKWTKSNLNFPFSNRDLVT